MKIKNNYILRKVADRYFAVSTESTAKNAMISVNETAKTIWELLSAPTTEDKILNIMLKKYDAPKEVLQRDIKDFIEILRQNDILEEDDDITSLCN